jgi:hypothetical protein
MYREEEEAEVGGRATASTTERHTYSGPLKTIAMAYHAVATVLQPVIVIIMTTIRERG